jgi:hypothetical protein
MKGKFIAIAKPIKAERRRSIRLLSVPEIMDLPTTNNETFSLQVYAAAYCVLMQAQTGDSLSITSCRLLNACADEISMGNRFVFR